MKHIVDAVIVNALVHCVMSVVDQAQCIASKGCDRHDELKLLKGNDVCRSNTHPDMKSHVIERLATDHN